MRLSLPKLHKRSVCLLLFLIAVFITMQLVFGIRIAPDSGKYIKSFPLVGPVYPMFLDLMELLFGRDVTIQGQPAFLFFAVLFQNLFIAYALFSLLEYFIRTCKLRYVEAYVLALGFVASFLLQTIFTVEGRIASNTIMSEGLAFPLYYLLFKYLCAALNDLDLRYLGVAALLSFLASNVRGQLLFLLPLLLLCALRIIVLRQRSDRPLRLIPPPSPFCLPFFWPQCISVVPRC